MNNADQNWQKLVRASKHVPAGDEPAAPSGFSTRVVARWLAGRCPQPSAWELLSWRSACVALLVMLVSLGVNYNVVQDQFAPVGDAADELAALIAD